MSIYNKLPEEIKCIVDLNIQQNIKYLFKSTILKEIEIFHKKRVKMLYLDYYNQFIINHNFFVGYDGILCDVFFWMNHPYSQNMDTPFLLRRFTHNFMDIMKRVHKNINEIVEKWLNKYISGYDDNESKDLLINLFCYKYSTKKLLENILNCLTLDEMEELYIYTLKNIGKCTKQDIIEIPLNFNHYKISRKRKMVL